MTRRTAFGRTPASRLGVALAGLGALAIAASVTPIGVAHAEPSRPGASQRVVENSPSVRAWSMPRGRGVQGDDASAYMKAADVDGLVRLLRTDPTNDAFGAVGPIGVIFDDLAAGRTAAARAGWTAMAQRATVGELAEAWIILAEGDVDAAVRRAQRMALSDTLGGVQAALIREAAGDLNAAQALYQRLERTMDVRPPPEDEPRTLEEALRQLQAPQTAHILYRAALVAHRVGDTKEAERLYGLIDTFAPNSPDVKANRAALTAGRQPTEPALTFRTGLGRWSLFLSEEFLRVEGLQKAIMDATPSNEFSSTIGTMFGQLGMAFDPNADDWTLAMAQQLFAVNALEGADRILSRISPRSVFAGEVALMRGEVALRRKQDNDAVRFAQTALRTAPDRFDIVMTAAGLMSRVGRDRETIDGFSNALRIAKEPKERARALVARGYAHLFFGRLDPAIADARAALEADPKNDDVRIAAIAIFKDRDDTWVKGVALGRELLAEHPDSVARLNQLGYTLIHREEGLEEGFRLLHRGASLGENDAAVVDSLGWAYYLYGDFPEALRLIKRADELTGNDPNAEILDHLGDVYWRLGQPELAREKWRRALDARPEAPRRRDLEGKIRDGLKTPAPAKRPTPPVEEVKPRETQET